MFALPGLVGLGIALDVRRSAARIMRQSQAISILLILIGALRDAASFVPGYAGTWLFVGGLAAMLAAIVAIHLVVEARRADCGRRSGCRMPGKCYHRC